MMYFKSGNTPSDLFHAELQRLKRLLADMEAIATGTLPWQLADDDQTSRLDAWTPASCAVPCLIGRSTGHPRLVGAGRLITTSDLWLVSHDMRWARTRSRWYRLGERQADLSFDDGSGNRPETLQ